MNRRQLVGKFLKVFIAVHSLRESNIINLLKQMTGGNSSRVSDLK